jgi:hypothetical protein
MNQQTRSFLPSSFSKRALNYLFNTLALLHHAQQGLLLIDISARALKHPDSLLPQPLRVNIDSPPYLGYPTGYPHFNSQTTPQNAPTPPPSNVENCLGHDYRLEPRPSPRRAHRRLQQAQSATQEYPRVTFDIPFRTAAYHESCC